MINKIQCLALATLTAFCCSQTNVSIPDETSEQDLQNFQTVPLPLSDAETILGQPAHLTDSASAIEGNAMIYRLTYTANAEEEKTGKLGVLYYLYEEYDQVSSAQKTYSSIKTSNEDHEGFAALQDLGDEACFHSDGQNFCFIIVRKSAKMFRIKVNKITGTTSLDAFNSVAKNITTAL